MRISKLQRKLFTRAIKRGELSVATVAEYLGIGRNTVWRWCKVRGIDPTRCRQLAEARAIRRIMGDQDPKKRVLREDAADAVDTWSWKRAAELDEERDAL